MDTLRTADRQYVFFSYSGVDVTSARELVEILRQHIAVGPTAARSSLPADHTTIWRWVQRYAPELNKRCRRELKPTNGSWRVDETYICQGGHCPVSALCKRFSHPHLSPVVGQFFAAIQTGDVGPEWCSNRNLEGTSLLRWGERESSPSMRTTKQAVHEYLKHRRIIDAPPLVRDLLSFLPFKSMTRDPWVQPSG
jgi:hypothetical protein